ncbi:MAG: hypothetical protein JWR63_3718 [Conexibacter sp.]|jgi:hypothetical protein|nr:hypothetical protein [Conexibacter sp.]
MPRDPDPVTLADVIRRAVEAADPDGADANLGDLAREFEDDDEPVSGVDQLDEVLANAELDVDVEGDDPSVALAVAIARYLAHHRGAIGADDAHLVREAVRWQWHDHPPRAVQDLLTGRAD